MPTEETTLHEYLLDHYRPRDQKRSCDEDNGIYVSSAHFDAQGALTEIWHTPGGLCVIKHKDFEGNTCTTTGFGPVPWDGPD